MRFWELEVVTFHYDRGLFGKVLSEREEWSIYAKYQRDFDSLVDAHRRDILDLELPDDLCLAVLERLKGNLYIGNGYLKSRRLSENDKEISFAEVYRRFGGSVIEEAYERGVAKVG